MWKILVKIFKQCCFLGHYRADFQEELNTTFKLLHLNQNTLEGFVIMKNLTLLQNYNRHWALSEFFLQTFSLNIHYHWINFLKYFHYLTKKINFYETTWEFLKLLLIYFQVFLILTRTYRFLIELVYILNEALKWTN